MTDRNDGREANGHFAPGNRLWSTRKTWGPEPIFAGPDDLWPRCVEYFDWLDENPILQQKEVSGKGVVTVRKNHPPTIEGLCVHLGIGERTWRYWRERRSDLLPVITRVDQMIRGDQIVGGLTDQYNPNLTARITGLTDKIENDHKSSDGTMSPKAGLDVSGMPTEVLLAIKAAKDAAEQG